MTFLEYARMAWSAIRSNKLRSALTLLGMVVGVFSIIASVTAVEVIEVYFSDTINFIGSTSFSVQKYPAVQMGPDDPDLKNRRNITYEQILLLRRRARLPLSISPSESFGAVKVTRGAASTNPNVRLVGSDENWAVNSAYDVAQGRSLTTQDVQSARPVVVLGATVAEKIFPSTHPLGKDVQVGPNRFEVVGVLDKKGSAFGEDQDNLVLAPITRLFSLYGGANRNISADVRAPSVELLPATIDEVIGQFRAIRKVRPGENNDFEIVTNDALIDTFTSFTRYLTLGGAGIGLIALLAAGIGIMNIMLVSVTERTREIGTRKAVGATRGAILKQFLFEAVFLCQIGGLIGILLGVLGGNAAAFFFDLRPTFPWDWALIGVLGVTAIAVLFGVYPAWKAARLDPIVSLRYE